MNSRVAVLATSPRVFDSRLTSLEKSKSFSFCRGSIECLLALPLLVSSPSGLLASDNTSGHRIQLPCLTPVDSEGYRQISTVDNSAADILIETLDDIYNLLRNAIVSQYAPNHCSVYHNQTPSWRQQNRLTAVAAILATSSIIMKIWSVQDLSARNPACSSLILVSSAILILFRLNLRKNLMINEWWWPPEHRAGALSNQILHNFHIMKTLLEWYRRSHLRFPFLRSFVFAFSWESPSPTHVPQQIYHDVCSDLSICFHDSCLDLVCHLTHKKVKALSLAWQHLWLEIAIVSFLEIKGLTKQSLVFFFYIAQWRRCRRRKRNRWLHQAQRSSKGNKRTVFIPSICLHHNGCLLRTLYISASVAFMPKVIEKQFYLPAGKAAFLYGVIAITCAFFGDLTGEQNIYDLHILIRNDFLVFRTKNKFLLNHFLVRDKLLFLRLEN